MGLIWFFLGFFFGGVFGVSLIALVSANRYYKEGEDEQNEGCSNRSC